MKSYRMDAVVHEDFAMEVRYVETPAAANKPLLRQHELSAEDTELLEFLSGDQFSFEAMQRRWL